MTEILIHDTLATSITNRNTMEETTTVVADEEVLDTTAPEAEAADDADESVEESDEESDDEAAEPAPETEVAA